MNETDDGQPSKANRRIGCGTASLSFLGGIPTGFVLLLALRHLTLYHDFALFLLALSAIGCLLCWSFKVFERQSAVLLCVILGMQLSPGFLFLFG